MFPKFQTAQAQSHSPPHIRFFLFFLVLLVNHKSRGDMQASMSQRLDRRFDTLASHCWGHLYKDKKKLKREKRKQQGGIFENLQWPSTFSRLKPHRGDFR